MSVEHISHPLGKWGTILELVVRARIQISVAAYAYELRNDPIMSDQIFDWLAVRVSRRLGTCHPIMDEFFATQFSPMTGMWIHNHPELDGIERIYDNHAPALRAYYAHPDVIKHLSWRPRYEQPKEKAQPHAPGVELAGG